MYGSVWGVVVHTGCGPQRYELGQLHAHVVAARVRASLCEPRRERVARAQRRHRRALLLLGLERLEGAGEVQARAGGVLGVDAAAHALGSETLGECGLRGVGWL